MSKILRPLSDQVLVITGASSGIGLVTAKAAAARGAKVMLIARGEAALQKAVCEIEAAGGIADFAIADVGEQSEVEAAAARTIERFDRIDSWVNNAGVAIYAKLIDTPEKEHQRLFRTNYFGVVHGALAATPHLRRQGGALITVASIAADIPSPIMGAYAASKHAVKAYIESLRIELNADAAPISVTLIKPSGIDTPIAEHAANHLAGEALIPPLVYDPRLVAEAILDAAENPRRDVTVGGVGRMQVLLGTYFPALLSRFGGLLIPFLSDPDLPKSRGNNLTRSIGDGRVRSRTKQGRKFSFYTAAKRHPAAMVAGLAVLGGAVWMAGRRGR